MLYDAHCCLCDWDGYTDEPNGECPGCHTPGSLERSPDETDPEWGELDEWSAFDDDPGF